MHIYSSPRNMSVNFGSVSTKHEQHSLPNRLYPRQIWHCAHSFYFVSFYIYFFWSLNHPYLLCFWCIIWKNSTKISRHFSLFFYFSRSLCRRYFNPAPSPPLAPLPLEHTLARCTFFCFCYWCCCSEWRRFGVWWYSGTFLVQVGVLKTLCDRLQGCTGVPLGCGYKPFYF